MKKILITGAKSYLGESVKSYLNKYPYDYNVDIVSTIGFVPTPDFFVGYDVVFNVAGIAHIRETKDNRHLYYEVNRDLAVNIAKAAKAAGVKQFINLSSMSVYGKTTGNIKKSDKPAPNTAYGDSKYQADEQIKKLVDENFAFACLRPPMVYGKNCKGNYQTLRKFALKSPIFPKYQNQRSMLYIENMCIFVRNLINSGEGGLFFPQNAEYTNTSRMVELIAQSNEKKILMTKAFNWALKIVPIGVVKKVFGSLTYELVDTVSEYGFEKSVKATEV